MATILDNESLSGVDITGETLLLTYARPSSARDVLILPRVELRNVVGGGAYRIAAQILNGGVTPVSVINVPSGQNTAILQGRHLALKSGEVVTVTVQGQPADVSVDTVATLFDATPVRPDEFDEILKEVRDLAGTGGTVAVNHDYGGKDRYSYWASNDGPGIVDATILVYRAADYNAGRRGNIYVLGKTTTDSNGRWRRSLMLDPETYVLFYFKIGQFGPDTANLTVL